MWKLLTGMLGTEGFEGLLPKNLKIEMQNFLPHEFGIGLTSIALIAGNTATDLSKELMWSWIPNFYARLKAHVQRVRESTGNVGYSSPAIVAFTGKRQFQLLYKNPPTKIEYGKLLEAMPLPDNWPYPRDSCEIWVLPSSSGRSGLTHDERSGPYEQLARKYRYLISVQKDMHREENKEDE